MARRTRKDVEEVIEQSPTPNNYLEAMCREKEREGLDIGWTLTVIVVGALAWYFLLWPLLAGWAE